MSNPSGILKPGINDVLNGRGYNINRHAGNIYFRKLVDKQKKYYASSHFKRERKIVVASIVARVKELDPPGRFLSLDSKTELWHEISKELTHKKISQALRENTKSNRGNGGGSSENGGVDNGSKKKQQAKKARKEYSQYINHPLHPPHPSYGHSFPPPHPCTHSTDSASYYNSVPWAYPPNYYNYAQRPPLHHDYPPHVEHPPAVPPYSYPPHLVPPGYLPPPTAPYGHNPPAIPPAKPGQPHQPQQLHQSHQLHQASTDSTSSPGICDGAGYHHHHQHREPRVKCNTPKQTPNIASATSSVNSNSSHSDGAASANDTASKRVVENSKQTGMAHENHHPISDCSSEEQDHSNITEEQGHSYGTKEQGHRYDTEEQGRSDSIEEQGRSDNIEEQGRSDNIEEQGRIYKTKEQRCNYSIEDQGRHYSTEDQGCNHSTEDQGRRLITIGEPFRNSGSNQIINSADASISKRSRHRRRLRIDCKRYDDRNSNSGPKRRNSFESNSNSSAVSSSESSNINSDQACHIHRNNKQEDISTIRNLRRSSSQVEADFIPPDGIQVDSAEFMNVVEKLILESPSGDFDTSLFQSPRPRDLSLFISPRDQNRKSLSLSPFPDSPGEIFIEQHHHRETDTLTHPGVKFGISYSPIPLPLKSPISIFRRHTDILSVTKSHTPIANSFDRPLLSPKQSPHDFPGSLFFGGSGSGSGGVSLRPRIQMREKIPDYIIPHEQNENMNNNSEEDPRFEVPNSRPAVHFE